MSEPGSILGALKLAAGSAVTGVGASVALIQANPEIAMAATPSLEKSLYLLAFGVLLAAGKSYMPSEKKVDGQFEVLKAGHQTLFERLEAFAYENREDAKARQEHYKMLHTWMGGVDVKLADVSKRIARIERSPQDSDEIERPAKEKA